MLIGGKPREFIIRTRAGARGSSSAPRQPAITVSAVKVWRDKEPSTRPAAKRVVVPRVGKSGKKISMKQELNLYSHTPGKFASCQSEL